MEWQWGGLALARVAPRAVEEWVRPECAESIEGRCDGGVFRKEGVEQSLYSVLWGILLIFISSSPPSSLSYPGESKASPFSLPVCFCS